MFSIPVSKFKSEKLNVLLCFVFTNRNQNAHVSFSSKLEVIINLDTIAQNVYGIGTGLGSAMGEYPPMKQEVPGSIPGIGSYQKL